MPTADGSRVKWVSRSGSAQKARNKPAQLWFWGGFSFELRLAKVIRFVKRFFCTGELASSIGIWRYVVSNVSCKNGGSE